MLRPGTAARHGTARHGTARHGTARAFGRAALHLTPLLPRSAELAHARIRLSRTTRRAERRHVRVKATVERARERTVWRGQCLAQPILRRHESIWRPAGRPCVQQRRGNDGRQAIASRWDRSGRNSPWKPKARGAHLELLQSALDCSRCCGDECLLCVVTRAKREQRIWEELAREQEPAMCRRGGRSGRVGTGRATAACES